MAPTASDLHSDRPFPHLHPAPAAAVITDARGAASKELSSRMRRYTVAMAFRLACFIGMAFVGGWLRWTLLAFAVFLPYIAVVLANQSDQRTIANEVEPGAPEGAPALTTGADAGPTAGEVIRGEVVGDPSTEHARPAGS